jgi:tRNA(adenine34) deaminase
VNPHEIFLDMALREARKAGELGEVPVGAVIVHEGRVIGRGHNRTESLQDPTAHAEVLAITAAADHRGSWRLEDCTLYVTLEPCTMCGGAIVLARIPRLVFGAWDPKAGACGSIHNVVQRPELNHQVELLGGVREAECGDLLRQFFRERRAEARIIKTQGRKEIGHDSDDHTDH